MKSFAFSVVLAPALVAAQTPAAKFIDSARVQIDRAALAADTAQLSKAVVLLDRALVAFPNDPYALHYRGYARYRQAIECFRQENLPCTTPLVDRALADLKLSSDKLPWPETYSLLAALTSFRIAVDPSLARTVGAELGALGAKAAQMGPNNPRVLLMQALGAQRTPPEYGGGVDKAKALVARAVAAFATDKPGPLAPAWGREEAAALQAQLEKMSAVPPSP